MLRYFRINDPYRLIGLLLLMSIFSLPLFLNVPEITIPQLNSVLLGEALNNGQSMYHEVIDNSGLLAAWFHELSDSIFGRSMLARYIGGFILLFLLASYIGLVFIARKAFHENTFIPSFLFMVLALVSFDCFWLSHRLVGLAFLLLALNGLFSEIEFRGSRDETIFGIGLFVSLASLFAFYYGLFLVFAIVVLAFFTRTDLRKFLLLITGFLLPHAFVLTLFYLKGSLNAAWSQYYVGNIVIEKSVFLSFADLATLGAVPMVYLVLSMIMLQREARLSKYQSQILQIFFLWIIFSLLYVLLSKEVTAQNLIVFLPGLCFIFTHFFLFIRRKKFAEINLWILTLGVVATGYLARLGHLGVDYQKLFPTSPSDIVGIEGKRIMALEDAPGLFVSNELAGPFLDWRLSRHVFQEPDVFENIILVYKSLSVGKPDIIVDRQNLMKPFFERMPEQQKIYRRNGELYIRKEKD